MNYTANKKFGVGKINKIEDGKATIWFDEIEEEKEMILKFITTFETELEAEAHLEGRELTATDIENARNEMKEDARIMSEGAAARARLEEMQIESSKELKKHI